jgi:SPP1 gp7 family putative phage head morphogenesis protein
MKQFEASRSAESEFARALKKVARASGHLVQTHIDGHEIRNPSQLRDALKNYAKVLEPWAKRQSKKMLDRVSKTNRKAFRAKAKEVESQMRIIVSDFAVGPAAEALLAEQVKLIKSIPIEAGERAHRLALEAVAEGKRAAEIAEELQRTTEVTESRALVIARTEIARSNTKLLEARAGAVGSRQYRWHNSGDESVRDSHKGKRLQGMIFSWDSPPTLDDGMTGHPGTFPNCRCFPEPIFDDE